jgi:hypothetical protein
LYKLACGLAFGLFGVTFFNVWLPTPSYYSLTFQSLILYWISFKLLNIEEFSTLKIRFIAFLSFSSSLVFLSKPTAFAIIWIISMTSIWVFTSNKIKFSLQYNLFFLFFLLTFSSVFFGNPLILFERIVIASGMMSIQDPAYRVENILRFDAFPFSWRLLALLFVFTAFLASVVVLTKKSGLRHRFLLFSTLILFILLALYLFITNFSFDSNPIILLVMPLFFGISILLLGPRINFNPRTTSLNSAVVLLPLAYALGTNGNLWLASVQAIFFLLLFAWWLILQIRLLDLVLSAQILMLCLAVPLSIYTIEYGISNPYRQSETLYLQKDSATRNEILVGVKLTDQVNFSIEEMHRSAKEVGFADGDPIIDLTGQSPLAIFALSAYPVGNPWMVGGYAGSNLLAREVIKRVECKTLIDSWLLIEPNGPRSLDINFVLRSFGFSIDDYSYAVSWNTPKGAGGYSDSRLQKLYMPSEIDSDARQKRCQFRKKN